MRTSVTFFARGQAHRTYGLEPRLRQRVLLLPLFYEQAYRFAHPEVEGLEVKISSPIAAYEKLWVRR